MSARRPLLSLIRPPRPTGTNLHELLVSYLAQADMTLDDVNYVNMTIPDAKAGLDGGSVDVALIAGATAYNAKLTRAADNIRVLAASMVEKAKSGHPGGAMGGADFINVLYTEFLRYDPDDLRYPFRDRLFLDPGHMSPMLYSTLALAGNYTMDDLKAFRQWGSCTPGHPEVDVLRGVENTSGPLGQGHAMALGAAIAELITILFQE